MFRAIIVDDEEIIRNGLRKIVEESELEIQVEATCSNGKEALQEVKKCRPELMLLDINMPIISGLDIITEVMEIVPMCKIIIISGYDEFQYAQQALRCGVFDYLLKPVNIGALRTTLQRAVREYSKRLWEVNRINQNRNGDHLEKTDSAMEQTTGAINYIQENFADQELTLSLVAQKFHVSTSYLSRLIKQQTGLSFSDYITGLRIRQAKELLASEKHMIYEVASMIGYSSQHYFCRIFKEQTGYSPSDYRLQAVMSQKSEEKQ